MLTETADYATVMFSCCATMSLASDDESDEQVTIHCCLPPSFTLANLHFYECSDSLEAQDCSKMEVSGCNHSS